MNREAMGAFIAEARKSQQMTQRNLAEKLHVTDKAVSKWERGLSYPDVTLLEPLAAALAMNVEELLSCRRYAVSASSENTDKKEEPVKNLLTISGDSVRRERRRAWQHLAALAGMVLLTGLTVWYCATYVMEVRESGIVMTETSEETDYLYVREEGHLLQLKCTGDVEPDRIPLRDDGGDQIVYRLSCRWNRRTYRGTVTACEPTGSIILGDLGDTSFEAESAPLFGHPEVYFAPESYYPDPYSEPRGKSFLCDVRFWLWDAASEERETVLLIKDCKSAVPADTDGDGQLEVVVRTRWPEKPYTVYDWVDGAVQELWPDTVPQELQEQLICIWEQ